VTNLNAAAIWCCQFARLNDPFAMKKCARNSVHAVFSLFLLMVLIGGTNFLALAASSAQPTFKDCDVCPELIVIPAGSVIAGSMPSESEREHLTTELAMREQPAGRVTIGHRFALGKFELTRGQFAAFASDTKWKPDGPCAVLEDGKANRWSPRMDRGWANPGFEQADSHPVVCVNLKDVQAYMNWLSKKTGHRYRLPSGAEWEYAARGGTTTSRSWGEALKESCEYANGSDLARAQAHNGGVADPERFLNCNDGYVYTAPVGSFKANAFGLHDMLGNVLEWTDDCLNTSRTNAPTDSRARRTGDCKSQINRGGAWNNSPKYVRIATQHSDLIEARNSVLGFRVVREIDASDSLAVKVIGK
jgi:formylglycine-generating enzyme required for sulfatase activity